MQYIPCNSALLAQETLFLTQKGTFLPKDLQKMRKARQILIRYKKAGYSGLKFSAESKLFGGGPLFPHTTSATLLGNTSALKWEYHLSHGHHSSSCEYANIKG